MQPHGKRLNKLLVLSAGLRYTNDVQLQAVHVLAEPSASEKRAPSGQFFIRCSVNQCTFLNFPLLCEL